MERRARQVLVLGGGQLGRMLGVAAARLDIRLAALDPTPDCPAAATAAEHVSASFDDYEAVIHAGRRAHTVTVEIEHVNTDALRELSREGIAVYPGADELETVKDKLLQRRAFEAAGVPGPRFTELSQQESQDAASGKAAGGQAPVSDLRWEAVTAFGLPAVQKLRRGGYDGRGVAILGPNADKSSLLPGPSLLEALVPVSTELAVLVARTPSGSTAVYPPFELDMDPRLNLVRSVAYPARVSARVAADAEAAARAAVEALGGTGLHAVELFVDTDEHVVVNEVAPRPHNSGHLTIEAAETDQFEQHLRAVLDLPLGSIGMRSPAVMRNVVGTGPEGPTEYHGLSKALAVEGCHLHLYGKRTCRAGRKMGHLTVCAEDSGHAAELAHRAWSLLEARGAPR